MTRTSPAATRQRAATEDWFLHRGVPHLIVDYSPTRDILTRAAPLLFVVFVAELSFAVPTRWSLLLRFGLFFSAIITSSAIWMLANRLRGRATFADVPRFGVIEVAVLLLVPAISAMIAGREWPTAVWLLAGNLSLLALVYVVTSYAIIPLGIWAVVLTVRQLRTVLPVVGRILPTLLLFSVFMFLNAEMWKVAAEIPPVLYVLTLGLFAGLGAVLIWLRLPPQVEELGDFESWEEVERECGDAPCGALTRHRSREAVPSIPLHGRERLNVTLLLFISQFVQALIVAGMVTALYVGFGLLTISMPTFEQWVGAPPTVVGPAVRVLGAEVYLSVELLKAAGLIGAIGGMQFLVTALVDKDYQREFFGEVRSELRQVFAVRAVYRDRLGRVDAGPINGGASARPRGRAPAKSSSG
ncbi:MAG: hypothetical protein H0T40_15455 [Geodermatophilaceae bacterium]|nr:hypothetical protein [Geodermatophilaceae bacterium]